jgi:hypothetical protein
MTFKVHRKGTLKDQVQMMPTYQLFQRNDIQVHRRRTLKDQVQMMPIHESTYQLLQRKTPKGWSLTVT